MERKFNYYCTAIAMLVVIGQAQAQRPYECHCSIVANEPNYNTIETIWEKIFPNNIDCGDTGTNLCQYFCETKEQELGIRKIYSNTCRTLRTANNVIVSIQSKTCNQDETLTTKNLGEICCQQKHRIHC